MGNGKTELRTLVIKAGMTPEDVQQNDNATTQQKAMAPVFDADGNNEYSQREADVFNATTVTDNGKKGVSLWTRYADGSKKETAVRGDISSLKFAPKGEVKPYTKKIAKKKTSNPNVNAAAEVEKFIKEGVGKLEVEAYENGNIKTKHWKENYYHSVDISYYENGVPKTLEEKGQYNVLKHKKEYYPNGQLKYQYDSPNYYTKTTQTFYENGKPQTYEEKGKYDVLRQKKEYYPNGQVKYQYDSPNYYTKTTQTFYENGKPQTYEEKGKYDVLRYKKEYYPNGQVKYQFNKDNYKTQTTQTFYSNGKRESYLVEEYDSHAHCRINNGSIEYEGDWVKKSEVYYDKNGNIIDKAKVKK